MRDRSTSVFALRPALVLLGAALSAAPAHALEVTQSVEVEATPSQAWRAIGPFCAIQDWHPAITECAQTDRDGVVFRTLITADGGVIREQRLAYSDEGMSYTYQIVESELPVAEYLASLRVRPSDTGSTVEWSAVFEPNGGDAAAMRDLIGGFYRLGLAALQEQLAE